MNTVLLKCSLYPEPSIESMKTLSKSQWHFSQKYIYIKKGSKFYGAAKTLNIQCNSEKEAQS